MPSDPVRALIVGLVATNGGVSEAEAAILLQVLDGLAALEARAGLAAAERAAARVCELWTGSRASRLWPELDPSALSRSAAV